MTPTPDKLANRRVNPQVCDLVVDYLEDMDVYDADLLASLATYRQLGALTHAQWWDTLEKVQLLIPERPVSLEIGSMVTPKHLGVLGYMLLSSETLFDLLQRFERFIPLIHSSDRLQMTENGKGDLWVTWTNFFGSTPQASDEVYMAAILKFLHIATKRDDLLFSGLKFTWEQPDSIRHLESFFRCPIEFNQSNLGFAIPSCCLGLPLEHAAPMLAHKLEQQAEMILAKLPSDSELVANLHRLILTSIPHGAPSADQVAKKLGVSRRTLHYRLSEAGIDYSSIIRNVRESLAKTYLADTSVSLIDVALLLGYSEQSTFTRAFKTWTGLTPLKYRLSITQANC